MKLNALRQEVRFIIATFQNVKIYILKNLSSIFETFSFRGRTFLAFIFESLPFFVHAISLFQLEQIAFAIPMLIELRF